MNDDTPGHKGPMSGVVRRVTKVIALSWLLEQFTNDRLT